jgi:hypothetical protein
MQSWGLPETQFLRREDGSRLRSNPAISSALLQARIALGEERQKLESAAARNVEERTGRT